MKLPSTKSLQAFLATAEYLNFTHAADVLNMTQGALSRQIKNLEELVGVTLFYRQARGLALTSEGEKFVPLAEDVLNRMRYAVREVAANVQRVKVSAPSCITSWLLARLSDFQQQYPQITVELTSTMKHLPHHDFDSFDLMIVYGSSSWAKGFDSHLLFEEVLTPMCTPKLWNQLGGQTQNEGSLAKFTWLHANHEQSDWLLWLQEGDLGSIKGKMNQHFASLDQAMNAAAQGFGVSVGDVTLARQDILSQRLICPFPRTVTSGKGYYLIRDMNKASEHVETLLDWLVSHEK